LRQRTAVRRILADHGLPTRATDATADTAVTAVTGPRGGAGVTATVSGERCVSTREGAVGVVTQTVHGLGGVGKSTLAPRSAHAHRDQYAAIWWLTGSSPDSINTGLADLALHLHPARKSLPTTTTEDHARPEPRGRRGRLLDPPASTPAPST
jgi:hypothetical protein